MIAFPETRNVTARSGLIFSSSGPTGSCSASLSVRDGRNSHLALTSARATICNVGSPLIEAA